MLRVRSVALGEEPVNHTGSLRGWEPPTGRQRPRPQSWVSKVVTCSREVGVGGQGRRPRRAPKGIAPRVIQGVSGNPHQGPPHPAVEEVCVEAEDTLGREWTATRGRPQVRVRGGGGETLPTELGGPRREAPSPEPTDAARPQSLQQRGHSRGEGDGPRSAHAVLRCSQQGSTAGPRTVCQKLSSVLLWGQAVEARRRGHAHTPARPRLRAPPRPLAAPGRCGFR